MSKEVPKQEHAYVNPELFKALMKVALVNAIMVRGRWLRIRIHSYKVKLNKISDKGYVLKKFKTTEEYVCYNQICMANTSCISILANGNCSVCEMLYDNPEYILGNVNESSVREIWNSEKALNLYTLSRQQFPESSPCKTCESFEKCRNDFGKRVCYIDISKSGKSKWFPDPRCPHAEEIDVIL